MARAAGPLWCQLCAWPPCRMSAFAKMFAASALAFATAAAVAAPTGAGSAGAQAPFVSSGAVEEDLVLNVAGPRLQQYVVQSDDAWALVLLEDPARCGEPCVQMRGILDNVAKQSVGLLNLATVNVQETVENDEGDGVPAHSFYNATAVPTMQLYGVGAKAAAKSLQLSAEMAGGLFGSGPKMLFNQLRAFSPSLIASVRSGNLGDFFSRPSTPAFVPRVLLLSDKRERTLLLKKLSIDFASRAVFGQGELHEGKGKLAAAFGVDVNASVPAAAAGKDKDKSDDKDKGTKKLTSALLVGPAAPVVPGKDVLKKLPANAFPWTRYDGPLNYAALYEWLDATLPRAKPLQLRTPGDYDSACGSAPDVTLCFIAILPHEAEAAAAGTPALLSADELQKCEAGDVACMRRRRRISGFESSGDDEDEADDAGDDDDDDDGGRAAARRKAAAGARVYRALQKLVSRAFVRTDWSSMNGSPELKAERLPISISWIDAGEQPELAAALKGNVPGFVALNPRKKQLAIMRGSFTPRNAYDFVMGLSHAGAPGHAAAVVGGPAGAPPATFEAVDKIPTLRVQAAAPASTAGKAGKGKGKGKAKATKGKSGKGKGKASKKASDDKDEL